jgi:AAA domain
MTGLHVVTATEKLLEERGAKIAILGRPGVGKTSLLRTVSQQTLKEILFLEAEAGDICVADRAIATIRPQAWPDFRDIACALGGPNPAFAATAAYSQAHYQSVNSNADLAGLASYRILFVDSVSEASRRCRVWAEQQPEAISDRGRKDLRAVYGLVAREMIAWLQQLQHMRSRVVIFVCVIEKHVDDFGVATWRPQIEGQRTGNVLPAIVDEFLVLEFLDFGDGKPTRALVCTEPNVWKLPAKDRSGKLDQVEPPDLGALLAKLSSPSSTQGEAP